MIPRFVIQVTEWKAVSLGKKRDATSNLQKFSSASITKTTRKKGNFSNATVTCHLGLSALLAHLE